MSPSKDGNEPGPTTSKFAVKGFSLSSKSKPKVNAKPKPPTSTLGKRPRSSFAHDSGSDSEFESNSREKHEIVTGFGVEGAIKHEERKTEGPLIIPKLANRDWKSEARARRGATSKNLLPPELVAAQERARQAQGGEKREGVDVVNSNDDQIQWGLSVRKRAKVEDNTSELIFEEEVKMETSGDQIGTNVKGQLLDADEEALQALLGTKKEVKGPDRVIAAVREYTPPPQMSEGDAYKRAIELAPEVSTLEDYERVPVEEFGAALLRGMGWKGEKQGGAKEVKRRQNLLGLGAKELKGAEELGAWVQKSDIKRLNTSGKGGGGFGDSERKPKANEYRREKERRDERREELGGASYRRERERERDGYRDQDGYRERERDRRR